MVAVCQQPNYFPWLGYLEQCARADVLVVLDSVQWIRRGWQHRARILPHASQNSHFQWLTLPVKSHGHRELPFRALNVDSSTQWSEQHWKTLVTVYSGRPFFKTQFEPIVRPWFENISTSTSLREITTSSLMLCLEVLNIKAKLVFSSELPESGVKTERLIALCCAVAADTYYSGIASTKYIDANLFRAADIRLLWQHWRHPEYEQGRARFQSHLSFLDILANVEITEVKNQIKPSPYGPFA